MELSRESTWVENIHIRHMKWFLFNIECNNMPEPNARLLCSRIANIFYFHISTWLELNFVPIHPVSLDSSKLHCLLFVFHPFLFFVITRYQQAMRLSVMCHCHCLSKIYGPTFSLVQHIFYLCVWYNFFLRLFRIEVVRHSHKVMQVRSPALDLSVACIDCFSPPQFVYHYVSQQNERIPWKVVRRQQAALVVHVWTWCEPWKLCKPFGSFVDWCYTACTHL